MIPIDDFNNSLNELFIRAFLDEHKDVASPDTGSNTRFDSNLVNILVVNNLVNNLVVHLC